MRTIGVAFAGLGTIVAIGLLVGCSPTVPSDPPNTTVATGATADGNDVATDVAVQPLSLAIPDSLDCGVGPIPSSVIDERSPAAELPMGTLESMRGVAELGDVDEWFVVRDEPDDLVMLRPMANELDPFPVAFSVLAFSRDADTVDYGLYAATSCSLALTVDDTLSTAAFVVDGSHVDKTATSVSLLARIDECSSGQPIPEEELVVTALRETDTTVEIALAGRPFWWVTEGEEKAARCPGNPPTPITVQLDRPLGDRTVINSGVYPPVPVLQVELEE